MSLFKERFKKLRTEIGKTQAAIAADLGMKPQTISYYANGREPDYDTLVKIADYFHVSTDYLLGVSDVRIPENKGLMECTGLTEKALFSLIYNNAVDPLFAKTLSALLEMSAPLPRDPLSLEKSPTNHISSLMSGISGNFEMLANWLTGEDLEFENSKIIAEKANVLEALTEYFFWDGYIKIQIDGHPPLKESELLKREQDLSENARLLAVLERLKEAKKHIGEVG